MTKEKSNRQLRREKIRRQERQSRLITIGVIVVVVLLGVWIFVGPTFMSTLQPAAPILTPAPITRTKVDGLAIGDPKAPAKIEVFEDFQCPACRQFSQDIEPLVLAQLVDTGEAYYVFRHYPFIDSQSPTKESRKAANASMCANDQGKFWEYHDLLVANWNGENKNTFNNTRLKDFGGALNLDKTKFDSCVDDSAHADEIEASFQEGVSRGVTGTPTVFVNGQVISPGYIPSFDDIAAAVRATKP